ncbi:MAG: hypothetical protein ABIL13_07530 [candidate division WOR-3 bacterium]
MKSLGRIRVIAILLLFIADACSLFRPSPKKIVREFIESFKNLDSVKVFNLTAGDYNINNYFNNFRLSCYNGPDYEKIKELASLSLSRINYEIMGQTIEGSSATVRVKISGISVYEIRTWRSEIDNEIFSKYIREHPIRPLIPLFLRVIPKLSDLERRRYDQIAYTEFKNKIVQSPINTSVLEIYLKKMNGSWIISKYSKIFDSYF